MSTGLTIERRSTATGVTLVLTGELDNESVGTVHAVVLDEVHCARDEVVIDLTGLDFVSLAGVDALLALSHVLAADGRRLRVAATNRTIERIFEIAAVELEPVRGGRGWFVPPGRTARVPHGHVHHPCAPHQESPAATGARDATGIEPMLDGPTITVSACDLGGVELVVAGELDLATSAVFTDTLASAVDHAEHVAVNLAAVTFIDSVALNALLEAEQRLGQTGRRLALSESSRIVSRVLALAGLEEHFNHAVDRAREAHE